MHAVLSRSETFSWLPVGTDCVLPTVAYVWCRVEEGAWEGEWRFYPEGSSEEEAWLGSALEVLSETVTGKAVVSECLQNGAFLGQLVLLEIDKPKWWLDYEGEWDVEMCWQIVRLGPVPHPLVWGGLEIPLIG